MEHAASDAEDSLWCDAIDGEIEQEPPTRNRMRSRMMRTSSNMAMFKSEMQPQSQPQPRDRTGVTKNEENETCAMLKSRSDGAIRTGFTSLFKSRPPRPRQINSCIDIGNHATESQENENEQQEIVFVKDMKKFKIVEELHSEIEAWKECYKRAQNTARIRAKKENKKRLLGMRIENDRIKVELERTKLEAIRIQNKWKNKWPDYEKQVPELEQTNKELKTIVEDQREELERYQKILASNESQKSMDDVMNIISEKEKAKIKKKELIEQISKLESVEKNKRTQAASARKRLASKIKSQEDLAKDQKGEGIELSDEQYQEHLARARDLLTCQEARDKVLKEIEELQSKIQCAKAELGKLQSPPPPPVQEQNRWFLLSFQCL